MFEFIRLQYAMGRIGDAEVKAFAEKGFITAAEAAQILGDA